MTEYFTKYLEELFDNYFLNRLTIYVRKECFYSDFIDKSLANMVKSLQKPISGIYWLVIYLSKIESLFCSTTDKIGWFFLHKSGKWQNITNQKWYYAILIAIDNHQFVDLNGSIFGFRLYVFLKHIWQDFKQE